MSFLKRNKGTIVVIAIFLVIMLLFVQIKNIFVPNEDSAIYGTRLEGIEKVNAFFGTNISVKLNDKFNREIMQTRKETNENETV